MSIRSINVLLPIASISYRKLLFQTHNTRRTRMWLFFRQTLTTKDHPYFSFPYFPSSQKMCLTNEQPKPQFCITHSQYFLQRTVVSNKQHKTPMWGIFRRTCNQRPPFFRLIRNQVVFSGPEAAMSKSVYGWPFFGYKYVIHILYKFLSYRIY